MGPDFDLAMNDFCTRSQLRELMCVVTRRYDMALAPSGIKSTQLRTLRVLQALGPLRSTDLARHLVFSDSTLSRSLVPLVDK